MLLIVILKTVNVILNAHKSILFYFGLVQYSSRILLQHIMAKNHKRNFDLKRLLKCTSIHNVSYNVYHLHNVILYMQLHVTVWFAYTN